ncbi:lactoylglutathione lyase isoform X2 [Chelonia mydas]|uniref:lactoylglutathione lyase isoform X2 n=1 Tax=Chelonia mydas TaxID=8469 RepID=UPI001CA96C7C|nr:lactoylglutathione lyase isoform X2 [Chelonia mydas]
MRWFLSSPPLGGPLPSMGESGSPFSLIPAARLGSLEFSPPPEGSGSALRLPRGKRRCPVSCASFWRSRWVTASPPPPQATPFTDLARPCTEQLAGPLERNGTLTSSAKRRRFPSQDEREMSSVGFLHLPKPEVTGWNAPLVLTLVEAADEKTPRALC